MKMNNKLLIAVLFLSIGISFSQVGIGTTTPHASAELDITSTSKGFLPPRVSLNGTSDITTISSPTAGLMVYNTASAGSSPSNVTPGFYYYDGSKWQRIINQQPDATVEFTTADPNTGSPVFTPYVPNNKDYVYVSNVDNSQWTYNGSAYVTYTPPANTAWYLAGGTADAGSNKAGGIVRSGKVGIGSGITTPSNILEVNGTGGTGTGLKLPTGAGANKVLSSDANGNTSWATNVAITSAVLGSMGIGAFNSQANTYTGATVTLPPGKWSVQINMLVLTNSFTYNSSGWIRTGLSNNSSTYTSVDMIGPYFVSGLVQGGNKYNMLSGTLIVNNTSGISKTYYYWTSAVNVWDGSGNVITPSLSFTNFGRDSWGENSIVAYPMN
jgi:hypothetical protein